MFSPGLISLCVVVLFHCSFLRLLYFHLIVFIAHRHYPFLCLDLERVTGRLHRLLCVSGSYYTPAEAVCTPLYPRWTQFLANLIVLASGVGGFCHLRVSLLL